MATFRGSRLDPIQNRSLAIRLVLKANPSASADDIIDLVKTTYGHTVTNTLVYLVRSKSRAKRTRRSAAAPVVRTRSMVPNTVEVITMGRKFLDLAGSRPAASAILDALSE